MTLLPFSFEPRTATATPWKVAYPFAVDFVIAVWRERSDGPMTCERACFLAPHDRDIYDRLQAWALMNRDSLTVGQRADLFDALLVQPPSAKKTDAMQRNAKLCDVAAILVSDYGLKLTRNDATKEESAASLLAEVVELEEQTVNRILRNGPQRALLLTTECCRCTDAGRRRRAALTIGMRILPRVGSIRQARLESRKRASRPPSTKIGLDVMRTFSIPIINVG